jgi:hypothetical protein
MANAPVENLSPSNIETVDIAVYNWLNEQMDIRCDTYDGFKKVPVIWVSAERAYQIKKDQTLRDERGTLIPPIITLDRTGMTKSNDAKGAFQNSVLNNEDRYYISKVMNQKRTSEYANDESNKKTGALNFATKKYEKNKKIVYQYKKILKPIYIEMAYKISFLSQFQQQMNQMIQPFLTRTGSNRYTIIENDGKKFELFIDQAVNQSNNIDNLETEERRYNSNITLKVYGYLVGDDVNQNDSLIVVHENAVEVKLPKESIVFPKDLDA